MAEKLCIKELYEFYKFGELHMGKFWLEYGPGNDKGRGVNEAVAKINADLDRVYLDMRKLKDDPDYTRTMTAHTFKWMQEQLFDLMYDLLGIRYLMDVEGREFMAPVTP